MFVNLGFRLRFFQISVTDHSPLAEGWSLSSEQPMP